MALNTKANIERPDDFYQELIDLHRDLSDEQSRDLNAKLILILANHIGDMDVLSEAMSAAKKGIEA
ncbi:conserved hypothetical protein [Candidatus Terasakiella magnetica]|uniref:DUF2783 domain-containing protein n=1 Tax=Candidatus Terasakiella magnetica TaxID=1867952 RepID=A0A1C3RC23_9PROT|nr:DUF2783 domain-containing protein [Candidatus Terasakiella magnetica]SCA54836.1 conserved hypothetical protein [Candidatus Terasakiella magnetica]